MVQRIKSLTDEPIFIVPLWSSYLIWIGERPKIIETEKASVKWLDSFLRSRMSKIDLQEGLFISELPVAWTYLYLESINKGLLSEVHVHAPEEFKKFTNLPNLMSPILTRTPSHTDITNIMHNLIKINNKASIHAASFLSAITKNCDEAINLLDGQTLVTPGWVSSAPIKI